MLSQMNYPEGPARTRKTSIGLTNKMSTKTKSQGLECAGQRGHPGRLEACEGAVAWGDRLAGAGASRVGFKTVKGTVSEFVLNIEDLVL